MATSLVLYVSECDGNFDLRSLVGSDDLCAVLRPLCGLRLLSVCVCVCLFTIHVGTAGVDVQSGDGLAETHLLHFHRGNFPRY